MNRSPIPVAFFSIAVGSLALANAWRVAVRVWHLPAGIATAITVLGLLVWLAVTLLYGWKWLAHRAEAVAELQHPLLGNFAALGTVSTLLASMALLAWSRPLALLLFGVAVLAQLGLGLWFYGRFWQGGRSPELVTPAVYLPAVAQNFVAGTAAATFGWPEVGAWFFGAGLFSWLALESMIVNGAATLSPLPEAQRPSLGIQLAPPVVGLVTYLAVTTGAPGLVADLMLGYGIYQALLMLRLLPWIRRQAFAASYWGFSFGVAALPTAAMRMVERGVSGPVEGLAILSFVAANLIIGLLFAKTLQQLLGGQLLPVVAAPVTVQSH